MATIANLVVQISADMSTLKSTVEKSSATLHSLEKQSSATANMLGTLGKALAATFSVAMVMNFGRELLRDADAMVKLSDKTGMTIEGIQRLKYAAGQVGVELTGVTQAVNMMQRRLAGDDKSAVAALTRLGIGLTAFTALEPDAQFIAVAKGIAQVESPALRARLAFDLMGKGAAESLPLLIADIQKLTDEAPKMSTAAVVALDDIGDKLAWLKLKVMSFAGEVAAGFLAIPDLIMAKGFEVGAALERMFARVAESMAGLPVIGEAMKGQAFGHWVAAGLYDSLAADANAALVAGATRKPAGTILGDSIEKTTKDAKAVDLLKGHYHALAAVTYALAEVMDDGTNSLRGYYEATTGLTEDGLIPAWETFTDLLVMLPEYEGSLDVTRNMTEDVTTATKGWRSELSSLAGSFRLLQQSAGEGGLGRFAQSMADMFGAIEMGEQASRKLSQGMRDLTDPKIDPSTSLMKIGGAAIAMAAAMDQATQSTSRTMNMLSGAATGASMGANPALVGATGGFSILAGAAAGAIYGYYKDTPADDVRMAHREALLKQHGGTYETLARQMRVAGIEQEKLNALMAMGKDDLEAFTLGVEALNTALDGYARHIESLKTAATGTQMMADAMASMGDAASGTETQFQRLGIFAGAIFGKLLLQTGSVVEAMAAIGGTLDALVAAQGARGFATTPMMDQLLGLRRVMTENADIVGRVTGLGQMGSALGTSGLRGMGLLPAFGADLAESFGQLTGRGVGSSQAMMLMQAPLQQLWEATRGLGQSQKTAMFSAETLALLTQAEAAGLIGRDMQDIATRQLDVLSDIRDILSGTAAVVWSRGGGQGGPGGPGRLGFDYVPDPVAGRNYAFGTSGFENFGGGTPAMLHGWEAVVPYSQAGEFARDIGASATGSGGAVTIHVPVYLDGREVARSTVRHLPSAVKRYGVH